MCRIVSFTQFFLQRRKIPPLSNFKTNDIDSLFNKIQKQTAYSINVSPQI